MRENYDEACSIDLTQARKLIRGRKGGDASLEVVRRYCNPKRGCRPLGEGGPVIVLAVVKVAGRLRTMPGWVREFCEARAAATARLPPPPTTRSKRSRDAAYRRAEEALDRAGVK
jgi:hypothetical protein